MPTNTAATFNSDIVAFIAHETLPLARRQLVAYQFGDPLVLPKGRGNTYTATRYNRVPLPYAPLAEGVPPIGETMTIAQVTATAQQWGDKITLTDVAEDIIYHPPFQKAMEVMGLQIGETLERNTYNTLNAGTQVNYVNKRGSRAAITGTDVLDPITVNRTYGALKDLGAPRFMGDQMTDTKEDAEEGGAKMSESVRKNPHYVGIINPLVSQDFRANSTVVTAWSYSDINKLYNAEIGEWGGITFCESNMVPSWTGIAQVNGTGSTTGGSLASSANYYVQVTGSDTQNQYESNIYQVSAAITNINTATGSITLTTPSTTGYTYNVYIGTTTSPANLGISAQGPTSGPMQGQAVQIAPSTAVTITAIGLAQIPPAAPQIGVTVYPTYVIGRGSYGQVVLDDIKNTYLENADKSDPLNQLLIVGWKVFYGTLIENQQFFARIESSSAYSATFG